MRKYSIGIKTMRGVGGLKDSRMIAWFQSDRQEEYGCCSKVITVYFGRTALIAYQHDLLSQLCLTEGWF